MWEHLKRIIKPNGAIVMTASQPFTSVLVSSNFKMFRYEWVWEKSKATGFLNAKKIPLIAHENITVFYKKRPLYNPQKTKGAPYIDKRSGKKSVDVYRKMVFIPQNNKGERYPRTVIKFPMDSNTQHPTQKPVALMEYLIKTYTNEGETVLDFTCGSGTTCVACVRTGRKYIGIEKDEKYFNIANKRIQEEQNSLFTPQG